MRHVSITLAMFWNNLMRFYHFSDRTKTIPQTNKRSSKRQPNEQMIVQTNKWSPKRSSKHCQSERNTSHCITTFHKQTNDRSSKRTNDRPNNVQTSLKWEKHIALFHNIAKWSSKVIVQTNKRSSKQRPNEQTIIQTTSKHRQSERNTSHCFTTSPNDRPNE